MNRNTYATLLVCLVIAIGSMSVLCSDGSEAEQTKDIADINVHCFKDSANFDAGDSATFEITLTNTSTTDTYAIDVYAVMKPANRVGAEVSQDQKSLDPGKTMVVYVTTTSKTVAVAGDYDLEVILSVRNIQAGTDSQSGIMTFGIAIDSNYSSEGYYNKILGLFESPVDEPIVAGVITLFIWIGIGIILNIMTRKVLLKRAEKDGFEDGESDAKGAGRFLFVLTLLIAIPMCLRISGVGEEIVATVSDAVRVLLCLNIAYIIWKIYKVVMYDIIVRRDKNDVIDDSLFPLVKMVGETVILIVTISIILSIYGLDLGAIVTSAGIVTLAVSFGAQSTLNQFFCGLVLLVTRPFRIGDKVRLGTSGEVLIVKKIGVMETEFKVWLNEEIQHIPNSAVMGSSIINITKGDKCYKVVDYIDIDYNADIDKARDIIMGILSKHPKIVNDGSKSKPDFRFSSMESSSIRIRISYIVYDHEVWHSVSCQIKEAIYKKFLAEGVKVPHNIVDVHMG